jgi:hypothetical protein
METETPTAGELLTILEAVYRVKSPRRAGRLLFPGDETPIE